MKKMITYFGNGLLFLIPIAVTLWVIYWVFTTIETAVRAIVLGGASNEQPQWWVSGLGVVISLGFITIVGMLSSLFITRPLLQLVEKVFGRLPLIKLLYSSIKDLIGAFVGDKKKFDQPCLVTLMPQSNIKALGFVTRKSVDFLHLQDEVAVYLPQSYNFAGSVLIVPRSQVKLLEMDSSDVMTFIVSGGVSGGHGSEASGD